jgi:hypothetical protein
VYWADSGSLLEALPLPLGVDADTVCAWGPTIGIRDGARLGVLGLKNSEIGGIQLSEPDDWPAGTRLTRSWRSIA